MIVTAQIRRRSLTFLALHRRATLGALMLLAAAGVAPAAAADRWEEAAGGAVAILPTPSKATVILGGSLACAEQRWQFRLRTEPRNAPPSTADATMSVDKAESPVKAEQTASLITVAIPAETIEDLKSGTRLAFAFGSGKDDPAATFSLRFSKQVIDAVAPRCSQIDMSAYDQITLANTGPALDAARPLFDEEIKLFRDATKNEPVLAAAEIKVAADREMLVASLCGSTWYYGRSGCTLSAYVRRTPSTVWQEAFNSEGILIYTDAKNAVDGWPNLVTLPVVGGVEPSHWVWSGTAYRAEGEEPLAEAPDEASQGDGSE